MRTLLPHPQLRDVTLRPAAVAMVWLGPDLPHETVAVPGVPLGRGDALASVELSTICDSDLSILHGRRPAAAPLVLGHESIGRIIALGEGGATAADGSELRIGDRVVWSVTISCGTCDRCLAGMPQKCRTLARYGHERIGPRWELTGGFASHVHLRAGTAIVRVPEALPAAVLAPASWATATSWAAIARAMTVRGGQAPTGAGTALDGVRVLIHGAGLVGMTAAAIAASEGARVTVVDPDDRRRALAVRYGADEAVARAETCTGDIVIESSGSAVADALAAADVGGAVVLLGGSAGGSVPLDAEGLVQRIVTVAGACDYTPADLIAAVGFLTGRGRAFPFADAVGAVHPLSEIDAALAAAAAPGAPLRVAVQPGR